MVSKWYVNAFLKGGTTRKHKWLLSTCVDIKWQSHLLITEIFIQFCRYSESYTIIRNILCKPVMSHWSISTLGHGRLDLCKLLLI